MIHCISCFISIRINLPLSTFLLKIRRNETIKFNWFECHNGNIFLFFTSLISFFFDVQFQFSACFFKLFFYSMTLFEPSFNVIDNLISTKRWAFQPFLFYFLLFYRYGLLFLGSQFTRTWSWSNQSFLWWEILLAFPK